MHAMLYTDKRGRSHGRVVMYIHEDVTLLTVLSHLNSVCDTLIVHLKQLDLVICRLYHPSDASNHNDKFEESLTMIKEVLTTLDQYINILLMVYFNWWPEGGIFSGMTHKECNRAELLLELTKTMYMEKTILSPTRNNNNMELINNVWISLVIFSDHNWVLKQLNWSNVAVIYLDIAKAFEKVIHGMICHKLHDLGIVGKLRG